MALLTADMKMAEVIHQNCLLIPVINRFGIRLGFGEKTVRAVCNEHQIEPEFLLTIINTFNNESYFPEKKLQAFNVLIIVKYLRKTHQYYIYNQIPLIERHINTLITTCKKECKDLELVKKFFLVYKNELEVHIKREETIIFPYIESIYNLLHHSFNEETYQEIIGKYSINKFDEEHDNIDDKLFDLQNILIKYVTDDFDESLCTEIIFELFSLEKDIKDHTRIEDKVLIPLVAEMEIGLKSKKSS
jgi:regulator of cell morphogenesis and NO signaling